MPARTASPPPTPAGNARWRFGADVAAQSFVGPAPTAMPGVAVYGVAALDRDSPWSPAVVLGATHAWATGLTEPGGTASFILDAASVDACALRVQISIVDVGACASALLGRLRSNGAATIERATRDRPFAFAGAAAIVTVHLGATFALTARFAGGDTIVRDSYKFAPVVFYQATPVTLAGSVGLGVRVP
jgi:hypothetical protein